MLWPTIKKYVKYVAIILVGIGALILAILIYSWLKKKSVADDGSVHVQKLGDVVTEIGSQLNEAHVQAEVEIAAGRDDETVTKEELKKVVAIKDKKERRQKLTEMYAKVYP